MTHEHLGIYSDLVAAAQRAHPLDRVARPGKASQRKLIETLAFKPGPVKPAAVRIVKRWTRDGVAGELVSWSVGYGPRTEAYVLRPEGAAGKLPGVVALHDHGGFKYFGKEKIADGPASAPPVLRQFRDRCYEGAAFANELARRGFVVLVPDVFLWGSRRFDERTLRAAGMDAHWPIPADATVVERFNAMCIPHEQLVEKYCALMGTTLAGIVSFEDRVAAAYLRSRRDVAAGSIGCVGLSGGGMRSVLLQGTCDRIGAAVVVGAMCTYPALYDHNVVCHTWMVFPHGWARHGDWSDIAAVRAPSPLMVQNDNEDPLYTPAGMRAAHRRIAGHYRARGAAKNYVGRFYPGLHKFDRAMQADAFDFLDRHLRR